AQTERRGDGRAGEGSAWRRAPTGRVVCCNSWTPSRFATRQARRGVSRDRPPGAARETLLTTSQSVRSREQVIVARGGMIPDDQGRQVKADRPQAVDTASHPEAAGAARARAPTVGVVGGHGRGAEVDAGPGADEGATPQPVAAVAARTARAAQDQ